ncbi:Atg14 domain-containing protein [Nostoc sp. UHCC 0870]|uniref:Atg14 domain-containing protein n=1 Tax=Nostoc sp. UHCC 0870 TaxID=2914041 RepID=UPI001EE03EDE|nr:Atg14 domain-containing protein [Nostoc sp. UHCC 0870]UKP01213.1 Atg14 domain-containing protein [Nostoc sp. UHCC 0870]
MIEVSDAEKIEKDYLETLENLIKIIYESAKRRGIKSSNEISIAVDNENVYRGKIDDNNFNKINPFIDKNLVDKLNQAIFEPQNLKGKVSIKIGEEEVFHVEDGVVVKDKLGLSQPLSQTQENESQKNKPIVERTYSVEELQKQVNVLQKKVQEQQELVESLKSGQLNEESIAQLAQQIGELFKSLEKQQKLIEKTQQTLAKVNRSLPAIQNTKLQNFVGGIEKGVKQIAQGLFKSLKDSVMSRVNHTKQQMNGMKSQVKSKVDNWKHKTHQWSENAKGKAIEKKCESIAENFGKI